MQVIAIESSHDVPDVAKFFSKEERSSTRLKTFPYLELTRAAELPEATMVMRKSKAGDAAESVCLGVVPCGMLMA